MQDSEEELDLHLSPISTTLGHIIATTAVFAIRDIRVVTSFVSFGNSDDLTKTVNTCFINIPVAFVTPWPETPSPQFRLPLTPPLIGVLPMYFMATDPVLRMP